jgi:hypothetical protein
MRENLKNSCITKFIEVFEAINSDLLYLSKNLHMADLELARIEYADEYIAQLNSSFEITMDDIIEASNRMEFPFWISALFWMRDAIMRCLHIKTRSDSPVAGTGTTFGLFPILSRIPGEIIAGVDDRHLNFRVVVRLAKIENGLQQVSFRTQVQFNNVFGRIYFIPVKPLHKIIVPAMLKKFSKRVCSNK